MAFGCFCNITIVSGDLLLGKKQILAKMDANISVHTYIHIQTNYTIIIIKTRDYQLPSN